MATTEYVTGIHEYFHLWLMYHADGDDDYYHFIRPIVTTSSDLTICDGWNYKYIGCIENEKMETLEKALTPIEENLKEMTKLFPKKISIHYKSFTTF